MKPTIFHELLLPEDAAAKVEAALGKPTPLPSELVPLNEATGRVLAETVYAKVDSPPFDRSEVDGYAVAAQSVYGAEEDKPIKLRIVGESIVGETPKLELREGETAEIATGAPIPRGANAVVMVEHTKREDTFVLIYRSLVPGENIAQTGSDVSVGDVALRAGTILTPREIAVLAALGHWEIPVYRKPRVAVFSTGDEIVQPGRPLPPAKVFDINGAAVATLVEETGAAAVYRGILPDDPAEIKRTLSKAFEDHDVVLTSGSTSAGLGDVVYRIFNELGTPGIVVHGLRIKPGKPTVAAVVNGKLAVGLPGFPVSAMIAFTVFVKPLLSKMIGSSFQQPTATHSCRMALRLQAGRGRREFIPVNIVTSKNGYVAWPLLGGSGAVSTLALADGFVEVPHNREYVEEGEFVEAKLFSPRLRLADLNIIGSHCPGIDLLLETAGSIEAKVINVGSTAGWLAVSRGEADVAGTHLLDEETQRYNEPFLSKFGLTESATLVRGYARKQGFVVAPGNPKNIKTFQDLLRPDVVFVNRNTGSGTRALIDHHLRKLIEDHSKGLTMLVKGYDHEAKTHSAVAAAVAQGRADVGVAVQAFAEAYGLDFIPISDEIFDFLIPTDKLHKPATQRFIETLKTTAFQERLAKRLTGFRTLSNSGEQLTPNV